MVVSGNEKIKVKIFAMTKDGIVDTQKELEICLVEYGITQVNINGEQVVGWVIANGLIAIPKRWLD